MKRPSYGALGWIGICQDPQRHQGQPGGTREKIAFGRLKVLRSSLERRFPEVDAFDAFGSQFNQDASQPVTRIAHPAFRRGVLGRAMHWGSLRMCDWAEALWCERPVPKALMEILVRLESPA